MTDPDELPPPSTVPPPPDLRAQYREQLLSSIGGWSGTVVAAIPPIVFVVVNSLVGLHWAIGAAITSALLLAAYRLARHQPVQQALTGLFGVLIASLIAARTGHAKGYFLYGIWTSFAYGGAFVLSLLVRRPIIGLLWEFLDPTPENGTPWYRRRALLRAYDLATLLAACIFAARAFVQLALFQDNKTGWLAVARIAMGYPLYVLAIGFGFWIVNRARRRLVAETPVAGTAEAETPMPEPVPERDQTQTD
jgi:hypothetical protein